MCLSSVIISWAAFSLCNKRGEMVEVSRKRILEPLRRTPWAVGAGAEAGAESATEEEEKEEEKEEEREGGGNAKGRGVKWRR